MTLPRRQRRLLRSIAEQLSGADPDLAGEFQMFSQLGGGRQVPAAERLPADPNGFWPALWAALGAGAWPADVAWSDTLPAACTPRIPPPQPRPGPWHQDGRAGGAAH